MEADAAVTELNNFKQKYREENRRLNETLAEVQRLNHELSVLNVKLDTQLEKMKEMCVIVIHCRYSCRSLLLLLTVAVGCCRYFVIVVAVVVVPDVVHFLVLENFNLVLGHNNTPLKFNDLTLSVELSKTSIKKK